MTDTEDTAPREDDVVRSDGVAAGDPERDRGAARGARSARPQS